MKITKKLSLIFVIIVVLVSVFLYREIQKEIIHNKEVTTYKEKHEKYRTLMYRTNFKQCFVDSCSKYGKLYRSAMGWEPVNMNDVDTVTVNEPAICN